MLNDPRNVLQVVGVILAGAAIIAMTVLSLLIHMLPCHS